MPVTNVHIIDKLFLKPEYLNNSGVSGNKYRKLKYNLEAMQLLKAGVLLTFGGAYSNHIAAVARAGYEEGYETIGVIRGEELADQIYDNPTLAQARDYGMKLKFISREEYRKKDSVEFLDILEKEFGPFYYLPEGGTNALAIKGCEEILTTDDQDFDIICCPVGTGGTMAGIINSSHAHQTVLGFPALKGDFLKRDIAKFAKRDNWRLMTSYHFGGYGKINEELISFINRFLEDFGIPLDPIYNGKMMFGIFDMLEKGELNRNLKILAVHTGGLQGIQGMNKVLQKKKLPQLKVL
ncbi:MAG: pyridoxal-phosphate dependent enzyme [Bacteroidia bacterium]|nr:pyridoxal-phosphate dependent enzyme [Bacteroidia bacterium]